MKEISSIHNSYIKNLVKLQDKSRERKKQGLFIIEGKREISLAISSNYEVDTVLYSPDIISEKDIFNLIESCNIWCNDIPSSNWAAKIITRIFPAA